MVWNTDSNGNFTGNATGDLVEHTAPSSRGWKPTSARDIHRRRGRRRRRPRLRTNSTDDPELGWEPVRTDLRASGTGPLLELNGSVVTTASSGRPAGRRSGRSRREMGTKSPSATAKGQYVVWNTDSNGNFTGNATGVVSADSSDELEGVEAAFGDETFAGAGTRGDADPDCDFDHQQRHWHERPWLRLGTLFELNPAGSGGPLLELNGSVVTTGQFAAAGWTPVGAVQTGDGYEVAFEQRPEPVCGLEHRQQRRLHEQRHGGLAGEPRSVELAGLEAAFGNEDFVARADAGDADPDWNAHPTASWMSLVPQVGDAVRAGQRGTAA